MTVKRWEDKEMFQVDLNSDMGESFGAYKLGGDEQIGRASCRERV